MDCLFYGTFCNNSPKELGQHKQEATIISGKFYYFNDLTPSWSQDNITKCNRGTYQQTPVWDKQFLSKLVNTHAWLCPADSVPDLSAPSLPMVRLLSRVSSALLYSILPNLVGDFLNEHRPLSGLSGLPSELIFTKDSEMTNSKASKFSLTGEDHNWASFHYSHPHKLISLKSTLEVSPRAYNYSHIYNSDKFENMDRETKK